LLPRAASKAFLPVSRQGLMVSKADNSDIASCCAVIIFIVLLIFMFVTYCTSSKIGNIGVMYDNLTTVAKLGPVSGNRGGSYLTFWSIAGLKFGILQTVSCWGMMLTPVCV